MLLTGGEGGAFAFASVTQTKMSTRHTTRLLSFATMFAGKDVNTKQKAMNVEQRLFALYASYSIAHQKSQTRSRKKAETRAFYENANFNAYKRSHNANVRLKTSLT